MNKTNNELINILITGASRGFGFVFAKELAKQGFNIYAGVRDLNTAEKLIELSHEFTNIKVLKLNVLDSLDINSAFERISADNKKLDILINNVGYGLVGRFESLPLEEIHKQFETNFFSIVHLTQKMFPLLQSSTDGSLLINISSVASFVGLPSMMAYSASKAALDRFSMSIACENIENKLSVASIHPGPYKTSFRESSIKFGQIPEAKGDFFTSQNNLEEVSALIIKLINLKRQNKLKAYSEWPIGQKTGLFHLLCKYIPSSWLVDIISKNLTK